MTILQSLAAFYDRLDRRGQRDGVQLVPSPGLKPIEIDYVLEIAADGTPLELKSRLVGDARRGAKAMVTGTAFNPKPEKGDSPWEDLSFGNRTSGRRSYVFWDKTSYVFGVAGKKSSGQRGALEPELTPKSRQDHDAFVVAHHTLLAKAEAPELKALLRFLDFWTPETWEAKAFPKDAVDRNIAFQLQGSNRRIDEHPEARELARSVIASQTQERHCLISGEVRPYAPRHPQFKGVLGAQNAGAALVSYNADAFVSFDADKAATAPVSEDAAFKYGAALNWLLDRSNPTPRVFRLGETTVVLWADEKAGAVGEQAATDAEDWFWSEMAEGVPDAPASEKDTDGEDPDQSSDEPSERDLDADEDHVINAQAGDVRHMRRAPDPSQLKPDTRLHILGLSPNSGRIAVRFWLVDNWGHIAANIARHKRDIAIEPPDPRNPDKKALALLFETAVLRKRENILPRLGGELARAILTAGPYPRTLFAAVLARVRADKAVNAARAGILKAVINRTEGKEVIPVALNAESGDGAYNLGRLFAVYEYAEKSVAARNATIRDKYIGAASATPRRVFPILMRGYEHNASALAKGEGNQRGAGIKAAKAVSQILARFGERPFPTALPLEEQGRFFVGYYHQTAALYTRAETDGDAKDNEGTEP